MLKITIGFLGLFLCLNSLAQDQTLMGPAESTILAQVNNPVFKKNNGACKTT